MRTHLPLVVAVLAIAWLGRGAAAGDRAAGDGAGDVQVLTPEPGPAPAGRAPLPVVPGPPPPAVFPPPVGPDPLWDAAVAGHEAYEKKLPPTWAPDAECHLHFTVDAGGYLLQPHPESNPAFLLSRRLGVVGPPAFRAAAPNLGYEEEFAPRLAVGLEADSGFGLRTSWWHLDEGSVPLLLRNTDPTLGTLVRTPPVFGVTGFVSPGPVAETFGVFNDLMRFQSHLDVHVWDWDVTRRFHAGCWDFLLAGGLRYGYLSESYLATRFNQGRGLGGVVVLRDQDLLSAGHNFSGAGPTAALEVRRRLGEGGLVLYGSGRTSVLFGRSRTRSFQATVENRLTPRRTGAPVAFTSTTVQRAADGEDLGIPVEDLEVGLEWSRPVGPTRLFLRTGVVLEGWFDAGSATGGKDDLSFFGLDLTAGATY